MLMTVLMLHNLTKLTNVWKQMLMAVLMPHKLTKPTNVWKQMVMAMLMPHELIKLHKCLKTNVNDYSDAIPTN